MEILQDDATRNGLHRNQGEYYVAILDAAMRIGHLRCPYRLQAATAVEAFIRES